MSVISNFRKHLKSNPEVAKFVMPSTKSEVLLDLNGDGKVDFAFVDTTGNGTPDTFAIDRTGSGELNLYFFDADGNGLADTVLQYPDGQDTPSYTQISKDSEAKIHEQIGQKIREAMTAMDAQTIKDCLFGIRDDIAEKSKAYANGGTLARMRRAMKADPEMAALLCPSPKNELFFDLNGDGVTDFALIDTNHNGDINCLGIDLYGDGDLDLYLMDTDKNGAPDRGVRFKAGEDEPTKSSSSPKLEEVLAPVAGKFRNTLKAEFSAKSLVEALNAYEQEAIAAMKPVRAELKAEEESENKSVVYNLRKHLKSNPEVAKFLMPSTKFEVLLDLNGDGKMDFAFVDTTGNGTPDTFAIDQTGNGELNLFYYDADGNGIAETQLFYPDGEDRPSYTKIDKGNEAKVKEFMAGRISQAIRANDAQGIQDCLFGIRDEIAEMAKNYGKVGTVARMRNAMKADPEMAKLLCPSPKNELYFDLNGDGIADFALIDTNHSGNNDTLAIDLTNDGEFDLYLTDLDDNGAPDRVLWYADGADEPTRGGESARLEDTLRPAAIKFMVTLRSGFNAKSLIEALSTYKSEAITAMKALDAQVKAERGE